MNHSRETKPERRTILQHLVHCIIPVLIVAVGVGAMFALGKSDQGKREDPGMSAPEVRTQPALPHAGGVDIEIDGIVTPYREIEVAAEVGGLIQTKKPECRAGNFIGRGTVLVEIDPEDYDLDVKRYEAQEKQAHAELEELEVELSNVRALMGFATDELKLNMRERDRLFVSDVYSESERDQAERAVIASQNAVRSLENQRATLQAKRDRLEAAAELAAIQLEKARLDRARTEIKAPVDGVIVRDTVEEGAFVQKGAPLFVIEDTSRVEIRCNLEMDDLYWLLHQDAPVTTTDGPGQTAYQIPRTPATVSYEMAGHKKVRYTWQGELRRYDGIGMDERTRTIPCRVVVDDPRQVRPIDTQTGRTAPDAVGPPALVRGMFVTVHVHARPDVAFVKIPDIAVQPGKRTWRVRNGKLERIESLPLVKFIEQPGLADQAQGCWIVPSVESGIAAGDRLVVTPLAGMQPGMEVTEQHDAEPAEKDVRE